MFGMRIAAFLRANGWVLNLVFIALGVYFVAGAVNAVVARSIRVVPTADDRMGPNTPPPPFAQPRQGFMSIADRNLLGIKRENLSPVPAEAAPEANPNDVRACSLQINVRATLVADSAPEWSMAVLFVNNDANVFSINDGSNRIADDATLVSIEERAVVVKRRDHYERCLADTEGASTATALAPISPAAMPVVAGGSTEPVPGDMSGVTKISDTQYNVDRGEVDRALNNLSEVSTQARIVPSFKNGKPDGFKMFSIKPGSIYSKIGLQNGDVIKKINGYEMNSPDKALEIYSKLKDANSVSIELQRRGQTMNVNYTIGG